MRVMVMTKGDAADEGKGQPTQEMFEKMQAFNEKLVKAGIMLGGEGLQPSSTGARVAFSTSGTSVVDGPFTESKEVIAGYWIWEVSSLAEAVEWAKRCPFDPSYGDSQVLEIRPLFDMDDFAETVDAETLARSEQLQHRPSD
ncbi:MULTISPECIES: YciI family protein [Nocardia]|uniref:YciI family protein n=2 Tax=Nocardia TaxID=1817 RepID=A0A2T2YVB5_9NOCA|nr:MULTISPECIES: YciI family protein [Nocardia]MBF6451339.1 YciI family protein [Nocardia elegans]PSR59452.1 YciI family protein [Nocardia nova]